MSWYQGSPNQVIVVREPNREPRTIIFDSDGFYESDGRADHVILTGYAVGEIPGVHDLGHGTLFFSEEPPTKTQRADHRAYHADSCHDPECVNHLHACCGTDLLVHVARATEKAIADIITGVRPISGGQSDNPFLLELDRLVWAVRNGRMAPKHLLARLLNHNRVRVSVARGDSLLVYSQSDNLRTNAGRDAQSKNMGDTAGAGTTCTYIALTVDSTAPALTDTTLAGEITTGGLARAQGTYSHTVATTSYKLSKTFTASATHTAVQKAGMFDASAAGNMWFENTFTAVNLVSGDTLTVDWTINI